jgi:uncharacterized membrane protein YcfT
MCGPGEMLGEHGDRGWRTYLDRELVHFAYFYVLWLVIQWLFKNGLWAGGDPLAAFRQLALAMVEPFGTLWFIYLLPIFFVATKLLHKVPSAMTVLAAALLETARIESGWTVPDEFAARYVYFFAGYLLAPRVFVLVEAARKSPREAVLWLAAWAAADSTLAFSPSPIADYSTFASLPVVSLMAGFAGAAAVIIVAALLSDLPQSALLRYCGAGSLVIYLGFFLPMAAARRVIVDNELTTSVGLASLLVTVAGVVAPLLLHRVTKRGPFRFLFERPSLLRFDARNVSEDEPSSRKSAS